MNHKELTPEAVMIELNRLKTDTYPTTDFYRRSEALERAKRAVRKAEIAMKPVNDGAFGRCPVCCYEFNSELVSEYNIKCCPSCGQALDWR